MRVSGRIVLGAICVVMSLCAQSQPAPAGLSAPHAASMKSSAGKVPVIQTEKKWSELTPTEQAALAPLESQWSSIGSSRQKKWLEISKNFAAMPPAQQQALHSRMNDWVKLSPSERIQARLNYAQTREATKTLTPEEKKAKWEAYQALSTDEKRKLADTKPPTKSTAFATTPVPHQRLTTLPVGATSTSSSHGGHGPKIATGPDQVHSNTLLPQPKDASPKQ